MSEPGSKSKQLIPIRVTVNGHDHDVDVEPHETLIELVRDRLGLSGTKKSCDMQVCGACTVLLDGRPVSACTMLAFEARNTELLTIEGMANGEQLGSVANIDQRVLEGELSPIGGVIRRLSHRTVWPQ